MIVFFNTILTLNFSFTLGSNFTQTVSMTRLVSAPSSSFSQLQVSKTLTILFSFFFSSILCVLHLHIYISFFNHSNQEDPAINIAPQLMLNQLISPLNVETPLILFLGMFKRSTFLVCSYSVFSPQLMVKKVNIDQYTLVPWIDLFDWVLVDIHSF